MGSETIDPRAFRHRLLRLIISMPLLLGVMATICFWQIGRLLVASDWIDRTDRVIAHSHDVQKLLVDMERSIRGYQVSGKGDLLQPYNDEALALGSALRDLLDLVGREPDLKDRVSLLRAQNEAWSRYSRKLVEKRQKGDELYASIVTGDDGRHAMEQMREQIDAFLATQVMARNQRSQGVRLQGQIVIGSVVGLSCFLTILFAFLITRQVRILCLAYQSALEAKEMQNRQRGEERFRLLVQSVEDYAIFLLNSEGCIASWNAGARRFFDYEATEVLGRHFGCLYSRQDRANGKPERDLLSVELEGRFCGVSRFARHDDSGLSLHATLAPVRGDDQHLRGFSIVMRAVPAKEDVRNWPVTDKHELPFEQPVECQPVA